MKILRDMAIANQRRERFDYGLFRRQPDAENFMKGQQVPLQMRLDVLESFLRARHHAERQWEAHEEVPCG